MFLGYPLGTVNYDDDQAAQIYLMEQLADGNRLIGNLRYNTGYAFIMAPIHSLSRPLGQLGDRVFLLLQVSAYSTIPFLVYDIMRRRFDRPAALVTALVVLFDPFGLQWAHFRLPGWLIALTMIWALWLAQLAWSASPRRRLILIALASIGLGLMTFARFNFAPLVAVYGLSFFLWRHIPLRQRIGMVVLVGGICSGILGAYISFVHLPSTGTTKLSCITGWNAASLDETRGFTMRASNGIHSRAYAELLALPSNRTSDSYSNVFSLWRKPGTWVTEAEKQAFLAQPIGDVQELITTTYSSILYWRLGPCEADELLFAAALEAIARELDGFAAYVLRSTLSTLVQHNIEGGFHHLYLDHVSDVSWEGENLLGFQRAVSKYYNGHRVWRPGVAIYSTLFSPINLLKMLTPLALLAALWSRDWLLVTVAAILLAGLLVIAIVSTIQPRYYSMLAPLYSILIGWFLARMLERILASRSGDRIDLEQIRNLP